MRKGIIIIGVTLLVLISSGCIGASKITSQPAPTTTSSSISETPPPTHFPKETSNPIRSTPAPTTIIPPFTTRPAPTTTTAPPTTTPPTDYGEKYDANDLFPEKRGYEWTDYDLNLERVRQTVGNNPKISTYASKDFKTTDVSGNLWIIEGESGVDAEFMILGYLESASSWLDYYPVQDTVSFAEGLKAKRLYNQKDNVCTLLWRGGEFTFFLYTNSKSEDAYTISQQIATSIVEDSPFLLTQEEIILPPTTTPAPTVPSTTTPAPTTTSAPKDECSSNSDCGYKERCKIGTCVKVECTNDGQCSGCRECSSYRCVSCGQGPYGCYC